MAHFSLDALLGQLMVGLVNGAFYAMLSLGLALIFGMLNVVNFAHGAQYMLGAIVAWLLLDRLGLGHGGRGWGLRLRGRRQRHRACEGHCGRPNGVT